MKRREAKGKGEKKTYTYLNAEFKEQQGEIRKPSSVINAKKEENNRMGMTRDLFKKIRDTKGTFHTKLGTMEDRNGMDLTEAEDIRRGGKNTQKNSTKKIFMTQITTMV